LPRPNAQAAIRSASLLLLVVPGPYSRKHGGRNIIASCESASVADRDICAIISRTGSTTSLRTRKKAPIAPSIIPMNSNHKTPVSEHPGTWTFSNSIPRPSRTKANEFNVDMLAIIAPEMPNYCRPHNVRLLRWMKHVPRHGRVFIRAFCTNLPITSGI